MNAFHRLVIVVKNHIHMDLVLYHEESEQFLRILRHLDFEAEISVSLGLYPYVAYETDRALDGSISIDKNFLQVLELSLDDQFSDVQTKALFLFTTCEEEFSTFPISARLLFENVFLQLTDKRNFYVLSHFLTSRQRLHERERYLDGTYTYVPSGAVRRWGSNRRVIDIVRGKNNVLMYTVKRINM